MKEFLLFTLYSPLAAMGEVAVSGRRPGWERPARSAIIGLVAAALGITRSQKKFHGALESQYGFAIQEDSSGVRMQDFHTTQTPKRVRGHKKEINTRFDELATDSSNLHTVVSHREYCSDAFFTVALWEGASSVNWSLKELMAALKEPVFVLYFGRKACPLGLPTNPAIIKAVDVVKALQSRMVDSWEMKDKLDRDYFRRERISHGERIRFYADEEAIGWSDHPDIEHFSRLPRYEGILSREEWLFHERVMISATMKVEVPNK